MPRTLSNQKSQAFAPILLVIMTVFAFVPDGLFRFALPKFTVLTAACVVALASSSRIRVAPGVVWAAGLVFVAFTVRIVATDGFGPEFWGRWPRYEGVPAIITYLVLLLVGAKTLGSGSAASNRTLWRRCLALAMLLLALLTTLEATGVEILGNTSSFRYGATLGNATDMGIVGLTGCLALLPFALWKVTPGDILGSAAGAMVAIASGSRAVIIVLIVVGLGMLGYRMVQRWKSSRSAKGSLWFAAAGVTCVATIFALPAVRDRLLISSTVTGRLDLWADTWALIRSNWLWGIGPGHFVDSLPRFQSQGFAARVGTDFPADSPHLILLQWWTDGGVFLVIANLLLCAAVTWLAFQNIRRAHLLDDRLFLFGSLAAVVAFAVVLFTHFPTPGTTALAGLCAGSLCVGIPSKKQKPSVRKPNSQEHTLSPTRGTRVLVSAGRVGAIGGLAAFMVVAGMATVGELYLKSGNDSVINGQLAEAAKDFQTAESARPWDSDVALLAGQAFAGRAAAGDSAAASLAVDWSTRSLRSTPDSIESLTSLAVGQLALGSIRDAQRTLAKARELAPVNSQVLIQSGIAEHLAGHRSAALAYVRKAIALTPTPEEGRAILEALLKEPSTQ
ncbi:O-antigen ligase family protein [Arthrobacter sp. LFS091]|uniref:O-antigen ligase family protein n=1 Tax=Arthrobacter sp. LFS091 TaxID=3229892 RepID=UPI003A7FB4B0